MLRPMPTDWSQRLRAIRLEAGLTQQQLADQLGSNRSFVALVETGRSGISIDNMEQWIEACGGRLSIRPADEDSSEVIDELAQFLLTASPGARTTVLTMIRALSR